MLIRINRRGISLTVNLQRYAFTRVDIARNGTAHRNRRLPGFLCVQYVVGGNIIDRNARISFEIDLNVLRRRISTGIPGRIGSAYRGGNVRGITQIVNADFLRPGPLAVIGMHHGG